MNIKGEFYIVLSSLIISAMGLLTRELSKELMPITQVSYRIITACAIYVILFSMKGTKFMKVEKKHLLKLLIAGFFGYGLMVVFTASSFLYTSYGNASTFHQVTPLFILILGWLFLREKITMKLVIAASIAFIGAIMIAGPDFSGFDKGICFAVISAVLNSAYFILIRDLRHIDIRTRLFYMSLFGGFLLLPLIFIFEGPLNLEFSLHTGLILVVMALCNAGAYYLLNLGVKTVQANVAGILGVSQALFGIIISYAIGEALPVFALLGAMMILSSIVIINLNGWKAKG